MEAKKRGKEGGQFTYRSWSAHDLGCTRGIKTVERLGTEEEAEETTFTTIKEEKVEGQVGQSQSIHSGDNRCQVRRMTLQKDRQHVP